MMESVKCNLICHLCCQDASARSDKQKSRTSGKSEDSGRRTRSSRVHNEESASAAKIESTISTQVYSLWSKRKKHEATYECVFLNFDSGNEGFDG